MKQVRARTTSRAVALRFFLVTLAFLLLKLWSYIKGSLGIAVIKARIGGLHADSPRTISNSSMCSSKSLAHAKPCIIYSPWPFGACGYGRWSYFTSFLWFVTVDK